MKSKIMNFVLAALGVIAVFYVWKKFSGSGVVSSTNDLRTTGTAGDGFLGFYPGWRTVPTPSAQGSQDNLPGLITAGASAASSLIGAIQRVFPKATPKAVSTPVGTDLPYSPDDSDFWNTPGNGDVGDFFDTPSYDFTDSPEDWMYA